MSADDRSLALGEIALRVADHTPAMLAYCSWEQVCLFANDACRHWLGKGREQATGVTLPELLGPLYEQSEPYIRAALGGTPQEFERPIMRADGGGLRDSVVTYTPDVQDGAVRGFYVHVADVTSLKRLQRELERAVARVRALEGLLSFCMHCKSVRGDDGRWTAIDAYLSEHTDARLSHGVCPDCARTHYPDVDLGR